MARATKTRTQHYTVQIFGETTDHRTIGSAYAEMSHQVHIRGIAPEHYGIRDNQSGEWLSPDELRAALGAARKD